MRRAQRSVAAAAATAAALAVLPGAVAAHDVTGSRFQAPVPLGLLLAALLVFVINRRAFGWGMDFLVQPMALVEGVVLAMAAALVAALYPAWVIARRSPAAGLKEE